MWAITITRLDLSFIVHSLAKVCDDPGARLWKAAMRVLQYFWRTKGLAIVDGRMASDKSTMPSYVDFNAVTCPDDHRSALGEAILVGAQLGGSEECQGRRLHGRNK